MTSEARRLWLWSKRKLSIPWSKELGLRGGGWSKVSRDLARWAVIAVPIGLVAGLGAALFYAIWLLAQDFFFGVLLGISVPLPGPNLIPWTSSFPRVLLLPAVMGLGGVGAGYIAQLLAPEVAGHGTDQTIRAFHQGEGKIRARVPILKILASSLTLGTGGSGGREGPVSQIGGGFGSWWADILGLSARERRIALASGLGAGVGAIFRAPLGGAIYSAEIFYTGDFEPDVFVPSIISSVVSYSIFGEIFGWTSLFATPANLGWTVPQIPLYALLGVACAAAGVGFVRLFHSMHGWFSQSKLPLSLRAGGGAVLASACVLAVYFAFPAYGHFAALSALGVGYGFVQAAMMGQGGFLVFAPIALVSIVVAVVLRMFTTSLTVGSGGSAGLFGTSVVVGALLGASVGGFFHWLSPALVSVADVAAFVIVGMMAFFGGISKAPLAVLVMVVEMAGSYTLLLPAMLAIFLAYVMTGSDHLYVEQISTRLRSPAHRDEYRQAVLGEVPVLALTRTDLRRVPPGITVEQVLAQNVGSRQSFFPVVQGETWLGVVTLSDLRSVPAAERADRTVEDLVRPFEVTVDEGSTAADALMSLDRAGAEEAAVLTGGPEIRVAGVITRRSLQQLRASAGGLMTEETGAP